ncbi:Cytosolic seryl-tRNA synthetase [Elasticomyces elasticus]|nr:Cytosolic seryl-tRNA synthetase [Elasticomyces elasticus]KAK3652282.1 Cytosolic seryl-tRNA synthetase [Elasticomyces elasticus]KAK4910125.1 Cytosolic seryl-tRNA synthetase [Elasticomyces elasticus]KAK5753918.1 Cytosolic seryl-tRNA synthetase [Elasticomyces elasticus]
MRVLLPVVLPSKRDVALFVAILLGVARDRPNTRSTHWTNYNDTAIMLDINDFIKERGGDPAKIKASQRKRHAPEEVVDEVIELFEEHRKTQYEAGTTMGARINEVQKKMGANKKAKGSPEEFADLKKQKDDLQKQKEQLEEEARQKQIALLKKAKSIGNYVHESVPVSDNEDKNAVVRTWAPEGAEVVKKDCLSHHEVVVRLDAADFERGVKLVGHRGYCLKDYGFLLNRALISYGIDFLFKKGYSPNQPPFFMLREAMAKTAQLEQFDEELYKVTERDNDPATDKYLIATSEQPISAMHEGEWLNDKDLPIKYAGFSTNFRKEAGSHGKDAWGLFRVHQFEKVEQFIFCKPEDSWQHFDSMIATSEEFYKSLQLPYRVVAIVSGALNNAAAKKYDLEAWFPFQGEYKELVSCSNCTDYQTRELEIRYGQKKASDASFQKSYCHALNSTLCATERALCCVLENYQEEDGVRVPEVLRKYIPGEPEFLTYTKELPKDSTSLKAKGKAEMKGGEVPKLPKEGELVERPKHKAEEVKS